MATPQPFGFVVREAETWEVEQDDQWMVHLPHQCDGWTITGPSYYDGNMPHAQAVAELERFIAEANDALLALKARAAMGER